jgi:hypothetical protein
MKKTGLLVASILAVIAIAWAGGDPWKTKTMDQWTENDVTNILQNSPWVKAPLRAQGAWRPNGTTQMTGGSTGIPGSSNDTSHMNGPTTDKMGGTELNAEAAAAQATYSVFWWSSRTIRAASYRRAVLKGTLSEADADKDAAAVPDDYMILVQGTNMAIFQARGEDAFMKAAYLEPKRLKEKISPTKVEFLKAGDGQTVTGAVFHFPRKSANGEPAIGSDEKEIDFFLQIGGSKLLTYFDPRKMMDSKGEDL